MRERALFLAQIFLVGLFLESKKMSMWGLVDEQDKLQLKGIQ